MGMNVSKRVERNLAESSELVEACDAVYDELLALAQHAFPAVRRYQLADGAARLHALVLASHAVPLVRRWAPSPPPQAAVDAALRRVAGPGAGGLTRPQFRSFAVELYRSAVLAGAGGALATWTPAGMAGIAGLGLAARAGLEPVARLMAAYAVGLAAAVCASLT
ncbi:uncharacterized protein LOC144706177 [Wolffia australiana]